MKLLIVDDAKETRDALNNIIKLKIDDSYEIKEAENGLEALGIVESFKPDIVLTDILMPKMDGIRFAKLLKSQNETKHIFVTAITGLSGEEQIQKIYSSGIDFYISKPFQLDDIVARLKVITSLISKKKPFSSDKVQVRNAFKDKEVKRYYVTFNISQEDDMFLIFEYFCHHDFYCDSITLKDLMVFLIKAYRKLENTVSFDFILEESDNYLYMSVTNDLFRISLEEVFKNSTVFEYKSSEDIFSLRIALKSFVIHHAKSEEPKKYPYQHEMLSAQDLMLMSSDELDEYVNEVHEALEEYKALREGETLYTESIRFVLLNLFDQYTGLFKKIPEFDRVSFALQNIAIRIKQCKPHEMAVTHHGDFFSKIEQLNHCIEMWTEHLIVEKDAQDIHYLDYDIMNICASLEEIFI
jgi:CheY-like chemotaxis protein